jgi:hypothetical protein
MSEKVRTMSTPSQPSTTERQRRRRPRPLFIVCAAFLLALVLGSVAILALRDGEEQAPAAAPTPSAPVSTAPASPSPSVTEELDQTIPIETPSGVRWELWETVALPFSTEAGPRVVDGDVATGFAHTPTGALIAATQTAVRYRVAQDWRSVLQASVDPGAGAEAWANLRAPLTLDPPQPGQLGQAAGFQFVSYTPDRAVIQYVAKFANGSMQMTSNTVIWDGADWKLVLTDDGGVSATAVPIESLSGFIPWGGV